MNSWRLILSPPLDGASNMALDEAFFNLNSPPTLRFYSWSRPTVSVGRFQRIDAEFAAKCKKAGVDLVRRPTGGRALLHDNEITYSVSAPYDFMPESSTLAGLYKVLAGWQVASLAALGVNASLAGRKWSGRRYLETDACFLSSTSYEVNVGGRKISGSAQRRGKVSFLQHGSILIDYDFDLIPALLGKSHSPSSIFTTLKKEGCSPDRSEIIEVMASEFEKTMPCTLVEASPSGEELSEMQRLEKKYAI